MAVKNMFKVYDLAEMIEVETNGATAVDVYKIPQYTIIQMVMVMIKQPSTNSVNLTVGDDDDPDGFIVAAAADGAAGTVYGSDPDDLGVYLRAAVTCTATSADAKVCSGGKLYAAAAKEVKIVLSGAAGANECIARVFIFGKRFAV